MPNLLGLGLLATVRHADVVSYGASGAACIAAIAAKRSGASDVLLLSQTAHVGGMRRDVNFSPRLLCNAWK